MTITKFTVDRPDQVDSVFGGDFYKASQPRTQPELDERVQLGTFLKAYAFHADCHYPIEVEVMPRDKRPDFKVKFDQTIVGIEVSKIANTDLEQVRNYQRKEGIGGIDISSFLKASPPRTLGQKLNDCLSRPAFIFANPNQIQEEDEFWLERAKSIIQRKDQIRARPDFDRRDESWLLLWDKLSSGEVELQRRIFKLTDFFVLYWGAERFTKIIIQENDYARFLIISANGVELMQRPPSFPVNHFSLPDDGSLGID